MHTRRQTQSQANPFAMLIDLDQVVHDMEHSERLPQLHSRVYRPLDRPLIPKAATAALDYDRLVDEMEEVSQDAEPQGSELATTQA